MLISNYKNLINLFVDKKYRFIRFNNLDKKHDSQILLRHDIDLDIDIALKMAHIESELGVNATYFFLMKNESYNLLSSNNIKKIIEIKKLGHQVSLHFDMEIYSNPKNGLRQEIKIFENIFDEKVDIVSIHRPSKDFLENPDDYFHVNNSYEEKYTKHTKYFADSGGSFRFGNPTESKAFKNKENIQLLIHPVWWINAKESVDETVNRIVRKKNKDIIKHFKKNIKTYLGNEK